MSGETASGSLAAELLVVSLAEVDGVDEATLRRLSGRSLFDAACCGSDGFRRHGDRLRGLPRQTGQSSTLGGGGGFGAEVACALNALAIACGDHDDVHWETLVHLGGVVWPAVLAAGEAVDATVNAAYRAAALGHEVGTRLAGALGTSARRRWHATALVGGPAAAVGAASVRGGDRNQLTEALSHALCFVGGAAQSVVEHSGTMLGHRAFAARSGLLAADLAATGLTATRHALEGERGLLREDGGPAVEVLLTPRGRLALGESSPRLLPGHGFAHTAIAAAGSLGRIEPGNIDGLDVAVGPTAATASRQGTPTSVEAAWWNTPFCVAATLVGGPGAITDPAVLADPAVRALVGRCTFHADEFLGLGAVVTLRTGSDTRQAACPLPPGHVEHHPGRAELVEKWSRLGDGPPEEAGAAYDALQVAGPGRLRLLLAEVGGLLWPAVRP